MSTARPRRLALLSAVVALALVLPSAVAAGSGWKTLEGTHIVAHGEDYSSGAPRAVWFTKLRTSSGEVELVFAGKRPDGFLNGARVRVSGRLADGTLAVGRNKADAQVTAAVAAVTGERRVAVLLLKFAETDPEPYTVAQAEGVIFSNGNSVANYFAEESHGLMTLTGDVFGYYTISINTSACDYTDIGNQARAAATAAGVDLASYTQIQYVHNYLSSCGWSGLAYVPGQDSWLNQALNLRVSAHELSHNFGVHHASTMSCAEGGVRVTLSSNAANCSSSEYGDPFSILGASSTRHTHNQQLASMGWLSGGDLQTITSNGTYEVGAAELASPGAPRAVRVPRGNGTWFVLELRAPFGTYFDNFSADDPAVNGVSIRITYDWGTIIQSQLLDATPATTSFGDAPLAAGQSFFDPLSGVAITTLEVAGGVATVEVSWGADSVAPSTPGNPQVTATGTTTARFSWTASTDDSGVTGYRVSRDGAVLGTVTTTQYNDSGLTPGATYLYSVVALDAAGNESAAATRSHTQPVPDTTPPSAPANFRTTGLTKAKVTFAWNGSTDNVGVVGYRVYRNGALVATVTGTTWTHNRQKTASTYHVVAFDAAGNVSAASNSVTVPRR
jgi:hypothetical protein